LPVAIGVATRGTDGDGGSDGCSDGAGGALRGMPAGGVGVTGCEVGTAVEASPRFVGALLALLGPLPGVTMGWIGAAGEGRPCDVGATAGAAPGCGARRWPQC
jgi:hypothetical protein